MKLFKLVVTINPHLDSLQTLIFRQTGMNNFPSIENVIRTLIAQSEINFHQSAVDYWNVINIYLIYFESFQSQHFQAGKIKFRSLIIRLVNIREHQQLSIIELNLNSIIHHNHLRNCNRVPKQTIKLVICTENSAQRMH